MTDKPTYEELEQRNKELENELEKFKQAEEALIESEKRFRELSEMLPEAIFETDMTMKLSFVNQQAYTMFGYTKQDFEKGLTAHEMLVPEDRKRASQNIKKRFKSEEFGLTEYQGLKKDGSVFPILFHSSPIINKGTAVGLRGIIIDITERKVSEQALQESEQRFRSITEQSSDLISLTDTNGVITYVSPSSKQLFAAQPEEMVGCQFVNFLDESSVPVAMEAFQGTIHEGRKTKHIELLMKRLDGTTFYGELTGSFFGSKAIQGTMVVIRDITKRKEAGEALLESEAQYKNLFDNCPMGIHSYKLKDDGKLEFHNFNKAANDALGVNCRQFIGENIEEAFPPLANTELPQRYREAAAEGKIWKTEQIDYSKDKISGAYKVIAFQTKLNEMSCLFENITERKQAEEILSYFKSATESSSDAIGMSSPEGRHWYQNEIFHDLFGDIGNDPPGSVYVDEKVGREVFKTIMEGGQWAGEVEMYGKDKNVLNIFLRAYAIKDNGKISGLVGVHTDFTERKQTEEDLRESEGKYRTLFEHAGVGIILLDSETLERVEFNTKAHEQVNQTREEFRNANASQTDLDKDYESISKHIKDIIEKGYDVHETRHRLKNGELRVFINSSVPITIKGRIYTHNIRTDITDHKKLEAQLQQAQKMEAIGTLAGGIAHDFNNILSPIMMHSELAMLDLPDDSPIQHNLKGIYSAGERARDLVKQILTFSRKSEGERVAIKITPILKEVLKMLRSSIPTTIDIQQNLDIKSDTVLADPTQIHQIMLNLGTNSAHAMKEKGGILEVNLVQENFDVETAARYSDLMPGSYLKLTVKDTGSGIDDQTMQKIFEPYFTTKKVGEGTGMGLALVHGIVKRYGGDITVKSELGKGTTCNVYLPRVEETVSSLSEPSVQLPKGSERVLFVDDEGVIADVMKDMLENLGYKVTAITSSIEALEAFENDPNGFGLVITDMTMPIMTGRELAKEVMSIRSDIPIILCTGYSEQIDESSAKEMGISAYLMKPVAMHNLANTIRKVLDKK